MRKKIPFVKMHGLGNDFIVVDDHVRVLADWKVRPATEECGPLTPELARAMCDRRFGIGADQILWLRTPVRPEAGAHVRMEILNADGSTAEMCGNGIRAVALYLKAEAFALRGDYLVETLAGDLRVRLGDEGIEVDMGLPGFGAKAETLRAGGREFQFHEISMGNPHAVIFVDPGERPEEMAANYGPEIERLPRFPNRTNVEFVEVTSPSAIQVRVWERGAGLTLACGTGACAAAVATLATGRGSGRLRVNLPGGDLRIAWAGPEYSVIMEGPATEVFRGEYFPAQ